MEPTIDTEPRLEHLQPSVLVIILRLLAILFMFDAVFILLLFGLFGLNSTHDWHNSYIVFLLLINVVTYMAISMPSIKLSAEWAGRAYYLSGHHLIEQPGLVNTAETIYELSHVKPVVLAQTGLGHWFNYGAVELAFAGTGSFQEVRSQDIHDPNAHRNYFDQHLNIQGWVR